MGPMLQIGEGKTVPVHAVNPYGLPELKLHSFLTSALHGNEPSASQEGRFTSAEPRARLWGHPANQWVGTGFFFPSVKQLAFEIDHFQLASGKVKSEQSYIYTPYIRLHDIFNIKVFSLISYLFFSLLHYYFKFKKENVGLSQMFTAEVIQLK